MVNNNQDDWDEYLDESTKLTPFEMMSCRWVPHDYVHYMYPPYSIHLVAVENLFF